MREVTRSAEARHFAEFRCLGAECEDTCCDGWAVTVDQPTYEKYRLCGDAEWRARFGQFITINAAPTDHDYARIQLAGTACPFLSEGLCSIHKSLGPEYLSVTCASFPRVWNAVDGVLERSLDLGCPEAARRALLDPEPMGFHEGPLDGTDFSMARIASIDTADGAHASKPYRHFRAVRAFIVELLQNRSVLLWKRLLVLGFFCDKLQELGAGIAEGQLAELIEGYRLAVVGGMFDETLNQLPAHTVLRVETLVELIVTRITSDFTNRRFLACYKEFMDGVQWGPDAGMADIAARLRDAYAGYYAPWLAGHEYVLENYVINYVYRNLFPFGPQESTYKLRDQMIDRSLHSEFMLLAVYYSTIEMLLGGMAGLHKEAFGTGQAIQVIYTFTRTFEHSLTFPQRVLEALDEKGLNNAAGAGVLLKN